MGMRNNPSFVMPSLFFFCLCFNNHLSLGSDTISASHSISGDQTIVSAGGVFELGFCKPGNSSTHIYICTRYKKIPTHDIVWVANRETPISDKNSSELKIIDGNLVLLNESKIPVWSTNQNSSTSNSIVAVLLDDGNLVLREIYGINSKEPIWQSFDNPAHTWLPGGKITYDKRTNTSTTFTSWKNSEDTTPGLFSLVLDGSSNQSFLLWNGSVQYWTSGPWNGKFFSLMPEMGSGKNIYNFSYVDSENESYFIVSMANPSVISRLTLDISGQVRTFIWLDDLKVWYQFSSLPRQLCEVYALCGPFGTCNENGFPFCNCLTGFNSKSDEDWKLGDYSGGCVRRAQLAVCEGNNTSVADQERDKFMVYSNMKLPENPQSVAAGSAKECESACLNNCSCTAYAYEGSKCSIWIGGLLNLKQLLQKDGNGKILNLRLAASEFRKATNNKWTAIVAAVGSVGVVLLLVVFVFVIRWMRRRGFEHGVTKLVEGSLVAFAYKDLQNATKNFSEKLGGGGFGSVFKGVLLETTVIAVKKLESISQGEKQFRTEVSTIGAIQHVNLVRLRGFCSQGKNKLLVYDYMQKGSLNSHLFPKNGSEFLDWKTRYKIALGTARGLAYLHEQCRDCIIHCDIKPENILLDADFCPKIADFGLVKLFGRDFSKVLTTMRGTVGYIAPEWISGVAITVKADVYSYGMLLFEFISGRRNTEQFEEGRCRFFPSWAASVVIEGGDVLDLLDGRLEIENVDVEEVRRICRVACWCVLDDENQRPTMGRVVQTLERILDLEPRPNIPRFFQAFLDDQDD